MEMREEHFEYLEQLRQSGITNMWGAAPYLQLTFMISYDDATEILLYWIRHYDEMMKGKRRK